MIESDVPLWWKKIQLDLEKAAIASQKSFDTPGVIIGFTVDEQENKTGYLIRLNDNEVGEYPKRLLGKKELPTGVKLKSNLPDPINIVLEPDKEIFAFEVLREQIKLLPRLWLKRNITSLIRGEIIKPPASFSQWVLLPPEKKKDQPLIDMLISVITYEGLRGLARFNDYASS